MDDTTRRALDRLAAEIFGGKAILTEKSWMPLLESLTTLTPKEKFVIELLYGFTGKSFTMKEAGKLVWNVRTNQLGVTRERIRQIEAKCLRKLRHPSRSRLFYISEWRVMEETIKPT